GTGGEKDQRAAAKAVHYHTQESGRRRKINTRLWAFGYDMDNMKARGWHESHMPLVHLEPEYREYFIGMVRDILDATGQVADNLRGALKKAWFKPKAKVGGDLSFIVNAFWQNTEADFYALLPKIHAAIVEGGDEISLYHTWFQGIDDASRQLLSTWTAGGRIEHEDPKRIAEAHIDLRRFNRKKAIQDKLRLDMNKAEA
ncbi:MAG: type I-E CRISPR-associated protein Cse1/CasA, partial [Candidatus Electrothrix sp. MAN1_4]|nr:type I-E CRISPR-associated protein Cse1/CasA [Candidatus Electrothrix sp. MAN1_4]